MLSLSFSSLCSTFINNTVTQSEALPDLLNTNDLVVEAAVSSFRFPLRFSGRNVFDGNLGGGVSLVNTVVNIDSDSELVFMNNNATFGAGIQMEDRCLVSSESDLGKHVNNKVLCMSPFTFQNSSNYNLKIFRYSLPHYIECVLLF